MKKSVFLFAAAVAAVCIGSCKKYETVIQENYTALVNAKKDGTLVTDYGMIFKITDTKTSDVVKEGTRAYITCDIFKNTGDSNYDIRLLEAHDASVGTIMKSSEVGTDTLGKDPVYVQAAMISGGYVNIMAKYEYLDGSATVHKMNLVLEENSTVKGQNMKLKLYHDGKGEAGPDCKYYTYLSTAYAVLSYPVKNLDITDGQQLQLEYSWYESDDSKEVENITVNTTYKASSFVQEEAK